MLTGLAAAVALSALSTHAPRAPHAIGAHEGRDALLAEAAPTPATRTVTHRAFGHRNSFISVTHANIAHRHVDQLHSPTAPYGAHPADGDVRVLARVNHQSLAVDPWTPIEGRGNLAHLENARNQWLREQGYVEKVRTHINALPYDDRVVQEASEVVPTPRGVIEVSPAKPDRLRVDATPR